MFRVLAAAFALSLALPTTAMACGMYIPPTKQEATLADVLDSIDEAVVAKPADAKPAAMMNANTEPAVETADATVAEEDETRHGKRHKPNS